MMTKTDVQILKKYKYHCNTSKVRHSEQGQIIKSYTNSFGFTDISDELSKDS